MPTDKRPLLVSTEQMGTIADLLRWWDTLSEETKKKLSRGDFGGIVRSWMTATGGGGSSVTVNSASVSNPNLNNSTPAAEAGKVNVQWQVSSSDVSAEVPTGSTASTVCVGNDSRLSDARTPTAHATTHQPGGSDAMAVDAAAATGSLRTLGTAATAACAGNDSRLSDSRAPTGSAGGDLTGTYPNPTIAANAVSDTKLRDSGALSVIGRSANSSGDPADISATAASGAVLRESGSTVGFGTVSTDGIANGAVTEVKQTLADNTTGDVTSTKHGYAPKTPADATKFLNGAATAAYAQVKDSDLSTSDITTNDVSTSKHGFAPKAPNDTTKFLRGDATWAAPAAGANALLDGVNHTDTTAGTVARGDLITGQGASPTWTRKAKGSSGNRVYTDGTDVLWGMPGEFDAFCGLAVNTDVGSSGTVHPTFAQVSSGTATSASSNAQSTAMTSGRFYLVRAASFRSAGAPNTPTVTSASFTWTQLPSPITFGTNRQLTCFYMYAASTVTENVTLDFAGQSQDNIAWAIDEVQSICQDGLLDSPKGSVAVILQTHTKSQASSTTISDTLASAIEADGTQVWSAVAYDNGGAVAPGGTYTAIAATITSGTALSLRSERTSTLPSTTTVNWSGMNAGTNSGMYSVEIRPDYQMTSIGGQWKYTAANWSGYSLYVEGYFYNSAGAATDLGLLELYDTTAANTAGGSSYTRSMKAISTQSSAAPVWVRAASPLAGLVNGNIYQFRLGHESNNSISDARNCRIVAIPS